MQSVQNNQVLHDSANDYRIQQGQVLREQVMANNLSQNQQAIKRKPNLQVITFLNWSYEYSPVSILLSQFLRHFSHIYRQFPRLSSIEMKQAFSPPYKTILVTTMDLFIVSKQK